ncbi:MAG TPA: 50S ribosomal protein L15 [Myxococcota bacterium]|nr:50S ribosomal protein L15 [Myxococcota bacterium]HRY94446.1 50S ribosomal protein L15 [Myxococcota bacterium]
MGLGNLKKPKGATHAKKRIGRGDASGQGSTAGKGHKGQKSRSGVQIGRGFEGGQMPLQRRLPKRGFHHRERTEFTVVNVQALKRFEAGSVVDPAALANAGLIPHAHDLVKILGSGELDRALTVKAQGFSESAKTKITAAGGQAEVIAPIRVQAKSTP